MKRSAAEAAMHSGREVLRLRSKTDWYGTGVIITGIGYRDSRGHGPVPGGTGVRCQRLDRDGQPTGTEVVYPLSQLHDTTKAEWRAEKDRLAEMHQQAERERRELLATDMARGEVLAGLLGGRAGQESYTTTVSIRLTIAQAEALVARLNTTTGATP